MDFMLDKVWGGCMKENSESKINFSLNIVVFEPFHHY